jgi:hypothetical protein
LARQLRDHPRHTFVDYQYYAISGEPSAFFVVPVENEGHLEGWLVLQCAINKINDIFSREAGLGVTGEVFLVNRHRYMLTESRFSSDSSILKQHLSQENIMSKFREGSGRKIVVDYRGRRALSSFEVCKIAGAEWLLIAKIDEDEILTENYKKASNELKKRLLASATGTRFESCKTAGFGADPVEVDMDEFRKVRPGQLLRTYGVSTCTAVVISFPGKFSYMCHVSKLDRIYGGETTDLIGRVMDRMENLDIYPFEKRDLQITLIANHSEAIIKAVDALVDRGIFLSQIRFMYKGDAKYASPIHDCASGRTVVDWIMDRNTGVSMRQCASGLSSLGEFLKPIVGYKGR